MTLSADQDRRGRQRESAVADMHGITVGRGADAAELLQHLSERTSGIATVPAPLLRLTTRWCTDPLEGSLRAYDAGRCDEATVERSITRVRDELRRSVPNVPELRDRAEWGFDWPTCAGSLWPAAWLHHLDPAARPILTTPSALAVARVAQWLAGELATFHTRRPDDGRQSLMWELTRWLEAPEVHSLLGYRPVVDRLSRRPVLPGMRLPLLPSKRALDYSRMSAVVCLRAPGDARKSDLAVQVTARPTRTEVAALHYAGVIGAARIRILMGSSEVDAIDGVHDVTV